VRLGEASVPAAAPPSAQLLLLPVPLLLLPVLLGLLCTQSDECSE
jgi:hypothetical protein